MMRLALLSLLLLTPLPAQDPAAQSPARALHRGWLLEILDGNHRGAATLYEQASNDGELPDELRALALARLVELERLKPNAENLDNDVPRLRQLISELDLRQPRGFRYGGQPVPAEGLSQAAGQGEAALQAWLASNPPDGRGDPLDTRPFVPPLYEQLLVELDRARRARDDVAAQRLWRSVNRLSPRSRRFARQARRPIEILKLTLEGKHEEANNIRPFLSRRQRYVVPMPADPALALQTAQRRLESELARVDLNPEEREALGQLQTRLAELEPDGAREAVELLRNLPMYGRILLGERRD
jgi:hypothetical protein